MSPKHKIKSLTSISLKTLCSFLLQALSDDEGKYYKEVSQILTGATFDIVEELLKNILSVPNYDAATRFSCLEVLLREDVRRLETGLFPHSYYAKVLEVIKNNGIGLHYLNLKGVWARENNMELLDMLKRLKKLKILIIPHIVDNLILNHIIQMGNISSLDISGDCSYSLDLLCQFKSDTCKILYIGMFGKKELFDNCGIPETIATVARLIQNLPNLRALKTYSYTGEALHEIYTTNNQFISKLVYIHDTETTEQRWKAIENICPHLESVRLNVPRKNVLASLNNRGRCSQIYMLYYKPIQEQKLTVLKSAQAIYPELTQLLTSPNCPLFNLQTLKLSLVRDNTGKTAAIFDVSLLCTACPQLEVLECYKMQLSCAKNVSDYFMQLQSVEVLHCDVPDNVIRFLLLHAPFLRRAVIGDSCHMTDGDVFRLCADSEFHNLEELWLSTARSLTVTAAELLMGHCPNLRSLGQLSNWDITPVEVSELRGIIEDANVDLTLLPTDN